MVGKKFGRLTVLEEVQDHKGRWLCLCDCGNTKEVSGNHLRNGSIRSCGCLRKENAAKLFTKHGGCKGKRDRLYFVWRNIKDRTSDSNNKRYKDYGGRGISMCDEWFNSYEAFKTWCIMNGYDEDAPRGVCTIDRIDVNGNYEPSNCRFVTMQEQCFNKRNNHYITYQGITKTITEWARQCNISRCKLEYHIGKDGCEKALSVYLTNEAGKEVSYS